MIEISEDLEDYQGFEAAIIADYDPITAVERELVLRLSSLLWRLRRTSAIETDLLRIQTEILLDRRVQNDAVEGFPRDLDCSQPLVDQTPGNCRLSTTKTIRNLTHAFQRQINFDNGAFEKLGRYETALWRQVAKTLLILRHRLRY